MNPTVRKYMYYVFFLNLYISVYCHYGLRWLLERMYTSFAHRLYKVDFIKLVTTNCNCHLQHEPIILYPDVDWSKKYRLMPGPFFECFQHCEYRIQQIIIDKLWKVIERKTGLCANYLVFLKHQYQTQVGCLGGAYVCEGSL